VSVPDDLFRVAEAAARRLRVSRSQLYATALAEFLHRQQTDAVTERLNEVYSKRQASLDPALHRAQLNTLEKEVW
jgi:DNA-binding transcriptional MocR family regulator